MKIGVVMPCINLWTRYTKPAVDSVFDASVVAVEADNHVGFLLIDNASTDETQTEATKLLVPENDTVFYHRNEERWGFQKSVNYGVNHFLNAGYDYVLVLNNDIILHPKAIVRLVERMQKGDVGMATCMDVRGEVDEDLKDPRRIRELSDVLKEDCPEALNPHFSAFMVTTSCWATVGELDELFYPAYYEDNDYHRRMDLAGLKAIVLPTAMFYHYGSRTQNEALGRPLTDSSNQHAQYVRKWGGSPGAEQFDLPFNDPKNDIRTVKQVLHHD